MPARAVFLQPSHRIRTVVYACVPAVFVQPEPPVPHGRAIVILNGPVVLSAPACTSREAGYPFLAALLPLLLAKRLPIDVRVLLCQLNAPFHGRSSHAHATVRGPSAAGHTYAGRGAR